MDGVLIDSGEFHLESWRLLAEENGFTADDGLFWETFGQTNRQILPRFFGRDLSEEEIERFSNRKEELYREIVKDQAQPMPGVMELIRSMVECGWSIGIGSSGPKENVKLIMQCFELEPIVNAWTSAEDVTHGKPHPEVFLKVAQKLGVEPSRSVVVEDAIHGVEAAHAAGMKCIAITVTKKREDLKNADIIIDAFDELDPEKIERLLA